jgi:putative two-component system response regulator
MSTLAPAGLPATLDEFARTARFLIVDDELSQLRLLELTLEKWGYFNVYSTTDSREVVTLFDDCRPDIVLLDLLMPNVSGLDVLRQLQERLPAGEYVPMAAVSGDASPETRRKALALGARDYFVKPFDINEMMLRVLNLLETRFLHLQLADQNRLLEERVAERTEKLRATQIEVLQRLGQAAEYRDDETGQHTQRVGETAGQIAAAMGLPDATVELIRRAAPLHDVGKIGIGESILLKPHGLSPEEFEVMKTHTTIGAGLLAGGESEFLQTAERIALSHHERWNGKGYPHGLKERAIPLEARIVALADVFDAISHDRPYKKAWPREEALAEIRSQSGQQFDPHVVEAFFSVQDAFDASENPNS